MPISDDEFNRGKTRNSNEEIVLQILGDGKAYSLSELKHEVGIIEPKSNGPVEISVYILNGMAFKSALDDMVKVGKLESKQVKTKGGSSDIYYKRKDLLK